MTDLIAKAKRNISNKKAADAFIKHGKSLSGKDQEGFIAVAEFTALENASYDAFALKPLLLRNLRAEVKTKKKDKVTKVEQAIIKTFRDNPHLINTLGDLDEVSRAGILGVLNKHLPGEHDQSRHGNWSEDKQQLVGDIPSIADPGDVSEAIALAMRVPAGLAARIGDMGAKVNNFLNNQSGAMGKRVWGVAESAGNFLADTSPVGRMLTVGNLVKQHGPAVLKGGLRNYYRFSGHERPVDIDKPGDQGYEGSRNAAIQKLAARLPGEKAAETSAKYAPSEGYIIGEDGAVVARAIGRGGRIGDKPADFYTPFAHHQLKNVKGNTIVRRRAWGGPTEEDIRLGMLLGAKEITTISNTGTYTLKMSGEGQGVNSELPLILNRLTELRGGTDRKSNHDNTVLALESLSAEFPIHFRQFTPNDAVVRRGVSHEPDLPKEGFLTRHLKDFNESLFGEGTTAGPAESGGGSSRSSWVDSEEAESEADQLRRKVTSSAAVIDPGRAGFGPVRTRKVIDSHNAKQGADLRDDMPEDVHEEVARVGGALANDEAWGDMWDGNDEAVAEVMATASEFFHENPGFSRQDAAQMVYEELGIRVNPDDLDL